MKIVLDFTIKQAISNHPKMKWDNNIVKREVEFLEFINYIPQKKIISFNLLLKHRDINNIELKQFDKLFSYTLSNGIFFDLQGNVLAINEIPLTEEEIEKNVDYISECDYWLNLMIKQPFINETLIQQAITNFDYQNFFDI